MIVCVCRRVSDRDIHRAARDGVQSFDELQAELGVATVCGNCADCARDTWARACGVAAGCVAAPPARRTIALRAAAPLSAAAFTG